MDILNIQGLIANGKIVSMLDIDPSKSYIQIGVFQPGNRENGSGNANAYAPYVIPVSALVVPVSATYSTVEDNGIPLIQRSVLNFTGTGFTIADLGGKTTVNFTGSSQTLAQTLVIGNIMNNGQYISSQDILTFFYVNDTQSALLRGTTGFLINDSFTINFQGFQYSSTNNLIKHAILNEFDTIDNYFPNETASRLAYFDANKNLKPIILGTDLTLTGNVLNSKFTGNTLLTCITDIFVTNINSCSPLHIQPTALGDVYIVENGGSTFIGTTVSPSTTKLYIKGNTPDNTEHVLLVGDSNNSLILKVRNDRTIGINGNADNDIVLSLYNPDARLVPLRVSKSDNTALFAIFNAGYANFNSDLFIGGYFVTPTARLHIKGSGINEIVKVDQNDGTQYFEVANSGYTTARALNVGFGTVFTTLLNFVTSTDSPYTFEKSGSTLYLNYAGIAKWIFSGTGDLTIGTGVVTTARLHIKGASATSADYAFKADNLSNEPLFHIRNDGVVLMNSGNNSGLYINSVDQSGGGYSLVARGIISGSSGIALFRANNTNPSIDIRSIGTTNISFEMYDSTVASKVYFNTQSNGSYFEEKVGFGINTTSSTSKVDITGATGYTQLRLRTSYTPTGSADANGSIGDVAWDDNFIYIKVSTGWKSTAITAF